MKTNRVETLWTVTYLCGASCEFRSVDIRATDATAAQRAHEGATGNAFGDLVTSVRAAA